MNEVLQHPLGIKFRTIPFLWNYKDFANPFPTLIISKLKKNDFTDRLGTLNLYLERELDTLHDLNTDFYVHVQYKQDEIIYDGNHNDIYISYHGWCQYNNKNSLDLNDINKKGNMYFFETGIYPISGTFEHSNGFPDHGTFKQNKPGGIPINEPIKCRVANIHKINDIIRFSSVNVCNFYAIQDNIVFVSVGRNFRNKNKENIIKNVVVLHIFRNVSDNCPQNESFNKLITAESY